MMNISAEVGTYRTDLSQEASSCKPQASSDGGV